MRWCWLFVFFLSYFIPHDHVKRNHLFSRCFKTGFSFFLSSPFFHSFVRAVNVVISCAKLKRSIECILKTRCCNGPFCQWLPHNSFGVYAIDNNNNKNNSDATARELLQARTEWSKSVVHRFLFSFCGFADKIIIWIKYR